MKRFRIIQAAADGVPELLLYGEVGDSMWGDAFSARQVNQALVELGERPLLRVRLNSPGGDAFEGIAIHNLLKAHPAKVEVVVDGVALSAASIIAMGGDVIAMAENALMMIHDPWTIAVGGAEDMRATADQLDLVSQALAKTYVRRSGQDMATVTQMMAAETWFGADDAMRLGFADQIVEQQTVEPTVTAAHLARFRHAPVEKIAALSDTTPPRWTQVPADRPGLAKAQPRSQADAADHKQDIMEFNTIIKALDLADTADEKTILAAIGKLAARANLARDYEQLTGKVGAESLGVVRAWHSASEKVEQLEADNAKLALANDRRDFDALKAEGKTGKKLTPATAEHFEARFVAAAGKGAGADVVAELRGFLAVAPQVLPPQPHEQPQNGGDVAELTHDGKTWTELRPMERHRLNNDNPDLYTAMRQAAQG